MIAIGSDHGGFALKQEIIKHLEAAGCACKDYGTYSEEDHSGYEYVPGIGTVQDGEYTFDTEAAEE